MTSFGYRTVVLLHVLAVIVGYGSVVLDGVYSAQARRFRGAEAQAVASAHYTAATKFGEGFLYAVPVLGGVAVAASGGAQKGSAAWLWAGLAVFVGTIGVLHGLVKPARRRSLVLFGELTGKQQLGSEQGAELRELARLGQRLSVGSGLINLLLVVGLVIMIFKPGN